MVRTLAQTTDVRRLVEQVLDEAVVKRASDVHVEPTASGYDLRYRIDGLLHTRRQVDSDLGRSVVARLMAMAQLLTYRLNVPQEGRLACVLPSAPEPIPMRVSVMPTTHGVRAAVRLPAELTQPRTLEELSLPRAVAEGLKRFAVADGGMLLLCGPAGSGKTTTIYALLEYITVRCPGTSVIALEDPVERDLPQVTQIEVSPFGELTYERALRSIVRQDPQVLMLGEIRDQATASIAVQAALSGHRLISTLHAGDAAGAIARLVEMGLQRYQITSSLFAIVCQRLLRRRATDRAAERDYWGRVPAAEIVYLDEGLRATVLADTDVSALRRRMSEQRGHRSLRQHAHALIEAGLTDAVEVERVIGPDEQTTRGDTDSHDHK